MTEEQAIISSGTPHEVHLAEGSHTAVHKTATAMEPQIRNTLANPDHTVELIAVENVVSHSQVDKARAARTVGLAEETPKARVAAAAGAAAVDETQVMHMDDEIERPDRLVSEESAAHPPKAQPTALPLDQVMSDLPSLDLPAPTAASDADADADSETPSTPLPAVDAATAATQETPAQADTSVPKVEVAAPAEFMAEMNFPARVVKLKIANDQIRGQIEKLEKPLFAPIPVAAPTPAKGKEKEAAKKPAKGH
jgi:hypothetical protein